MLKKFNILLKKSQKKEIVFILFFMIITAMLESATVSLMMLFVSNITSNDGNNGLVIMLIEEMGESLNVSSPVVFIILLVCLYFLKCICSMVQYYIQARFTYNSKYNVQSNIINSLLNKTYSEHLDIKSAEVIRVVTVDVDETFMLLNSLMDMFAETIMALVLLATVIVINPIMATIIVMLVGILSIIIVRILKSKLRLHSQKRMEYRTALNKWTIQSVQGIKEIKVDRKEKYFQDKFNYYALSDAYAMKRIDIYAKLPKLLIENISMVSGLLACAVVVALKGDSTILPSIAAFAMAGIRLIPCASRINSYINTIYSYESRLDAVLSYIKEENLSSTYEKVYEAECKKMSFNDVIKLTGIDFSYEDGKKVFDDAYMEIHKGQTVGIIGKSGEGKTTIIDILLGLLYPQRGQVIIDKIDIRCNYQGWLKLVGYIPQTIYLLDDSIAVNVAFGIPSKEIDEDRVWKALKDAELDEFVQGLPDGLDTQVGEQGVRLSGGQRQRIGIARALYNNPDILVFDEATSALDSETESAVMESINSLYGKKTIIIIAHRLTTLKKCDLIYKVDNMKIFREGDLIN